MDLLNFVNGGIRRSGASSILARPNAQQRAAQRYSREVAKAIAATRAQWIYALQVDETAAWMSLYEQRQDVLRGLTTVMSLAALCKEYDDGHPDSPEVRIIRGALSAVEQAAKAGNVITGDVARALSSAARTATQVCNECTDRAIEHACSYLSSFVKHLGS